MKVKQLLTKIVTHTVFSHFLFGGCFVTNGIIAITQYRRGGIYVWSACSASFILGCWISAIGNSIIRKRIKRQFIEEAMDELEKALKNRLLLEERKLWDKIPTA